MTIRDGAPEATILVGDCGNTVDLIKEVVCFYLGENLDDMDPFIPESLKLPIGDITL